MPLQVLRYIIRLLGLCIRGPGGKAGIALYCVVLALELAEILVSLRMISWFKDFYDALQQVNATEALRQVGVFGLIVLAMVVLVLSSTYLRKMLEIRWRRALTSQLLDRWTNGRAYLRMGAAGDGDVIDNPDQRIAEDCSIFLGGATVSHGSGSGLIPLSLDLITRVVGLFSYVAVLWSLSTFALDLSFIGIDAELPRYMVWAAFVYVALSTGMTHLLGRPLKQLYVSQQRREADFRFALVRLRESAEAVALSNGEAAERKELDRRFDGIAVNWKRLINKELVLSLFTVPYHRTVLRIPTFLAMPAYFGGNVTLGGMMQLGSSFSQVVTTLSWFIFSYRPLAELAAASSRLGRFLETLDARQADSIRSSASKDGGLHARDLALDTPAGRRLLHLPVLDITEGESVWLKGASGLGKTTLLKALAGVWQHGSGTVATPNASSAFLPQQPYLPLGAIADAVAYPRATSDFTCGEIEAALVAAGLSCDPDGGRIVAGLSGGEKQKLALARLFLHRPEWIFLDEATSALDEPTERRLLSSLRQALPHSTLVVVSHRKPTGIGRVRAIDLTGYAPDPQPTGELEEA